MNYLAHAYLSFDQPQILAGNMISDFVKGKKQYEYDSMLYKGIKLHRAIDQFTDSHPIIKEMKQPFRAKYGLYAGAFIDIVCDYYLANDKNEFPDIGQLASFSQRTYEQIETQLNVLPEPFQKIFAYMKEYNWLNNYQFEWSIQKSFAAIVKRARYMTDADAAFEIFQQNITTMRPYYDEFFPLLKKHSIHTLESLINTD